MQEQPTNSVAVIIPTLNEEHFITCCLESVLGQTYPTEKMDIMVVDGGSTDNTCALVREMSSRCANIRLLDIPVCRVQYRRASIQCAIYNPHGCPCNV